VVTSTGGTIVVSTGGAGTGGAATGGTTAATGGSTVSTGGAGGGPAGSTGGRGGGVAATGGAAGGGGPTGGGSGACTAVFCDGFEAGTTLGAAWTTDSAVAMNVVEVVSTMPHTGKNSVHMHFTTGSGATFIRSTMGFPAPMNSLWGRVWMYAMMPNSNNGHNVFIEASSGMNVTNQGVRPLNTQGGSMSINVAPPDNGASSNMKFPQGAWTCFEWNIAAMGANGSVTLYMNGTMIATTAGKPIPTLVFQRVGYEHYGADTGTNDLYIDDYAIGTTRINCM
jgi:hypothetical protein